MWLWESNVVLQPQKPRNAFLSTTMTMVRRKMSVIIIIVNNNNNNNSRDSGCKGKRLIHSRVRRIPVVMRKAVVVVKERNWLLEGRGLWVLSEDENEGTWDER